VSDESDAVCLSAVSDEAPSDVPNRLSRSPALLSLAMTVHQEI